MNNIEILEEFIKQYIICFPEKDASVGINSRQIQALENLIKENTELRIQISARETVVDKLEKENKELKEKISKYEKQLDLDYVEENYIPKSIADYLEEEKDRLGKLYYEANEARIKYEKRIKKAINYINIDKEIEECCSIVDVNGIELLKILRGEK